jgi:hypothetical protein
MDMGQPACIESTDRTARLSMLAAIRRVSRKAHTYQRNHTVLALHIGATLVLLGEGLLTQQAHLACCMQWPATHASPSRNATSITDALVFSMAATHKLLAAHSMAGMGIHCT